MNGRICEQNKHLASVRGEKFLKYVRDSTFVTKVGHLMFRAHRTSMPWRPAAR